ncbi:MAG: hypothetical protein R3C59_00460 [Planctomycetaceae bacterium]
MRRICGLKIHAAAPQALAGLMLVLTGCLSGPAVNAPLRGSNALQISANQHDVVWERTVAVLNDLHFTVARESKLEGVIETYPRAGSNLFEPWHHDSVGYTNRLESTLQSIRRRVVVTFQPASPGMIVVNVRADKEIEDLPGIAANYEGGATFPESRPLERDLNQVVGQSSPSRWLPRGTDPALEAEIMRRIQYARIR